LQYGTPTCAPIGERYVDIVSLFGRTTPAERDHNELVAVQKQLLDLQREVEGAQRRIDAVDLHARAIVEEAKRLINKFERRLDRETPPKADNGTQEAPGRTIPVLPYLGPTSRRNY
jgi:hypothetical protein